MNAKKKTLLVEELPKETSSRIIGTRYLFEGEERIWDGKKLRCKHNRHQKSNCRDCKDTRIKCEHQNIQAICPDCFFKCGICGISFCGLHNNRLYNESHYLEALDLIFQIEGFEALSTYRLNELRIYYPLYNLGWNLQKICHRYGMTTEEWELRKKKMIVQSKGHIDWNENKIYEIWDILVQHYGYVPTANEVRQEFPKYKTLFGAMTELRISIDQVRAMYPSQKYGPNFNLITTTIDGQPIKGFKNHTRWTESVNGMRWHSRAEASVSNFLYGRGIHHKKGELYGEEFSRDSDYSRGWYDIHFEAQDGRYIDLEIWGNMDENYARKRRAKEEYNSNNSNFLGIDFDDCTESGLTKAFEPYIGIIEPYIFDKPEHRVIQTSFWTDAEEVIETCRWLADQQPDGLFPTEGWLRKRGKYKNRTGETYNTLGIYIQKYVGGIMTLRKILGEDSTRRLKWTKESVLKAYDEWMKDYEIVVDLNGRETKVWPIIKH